MFRTLLVINCALDESYANRSLLHGLYGPQFADIAFAISPTCEPDPSYRNIIQTWIPPAGDAGCLCGNAALGPHPAVVHSTVPRWIEAAAVCDGFDCVVFTEDDCLLSPRLTASSLRSWFEEFDCVAPPISYCFREMTSWMWASHDSVFPKFAQVASYFRGDRLATNWVRYRGAVPPEQPRLPLFYGFVDWLAMRTDFLRELTVDLLHLRRVWHEVAIPTAILHRTSRVGVSNGIALWGKQRDQSLDELMALLATHDFVHPVKLLRYEQEEVIRLYRHVQPGNCHSCNSV